MKRASRVFAGGVSISLVGVITMGVVNYLTRRLLARGLPAESYGFFYTAFALASLLITLVGGGLGHSATVLVAKYLSKEERGKASSVFRGVMLLTLLLGGVAATVLIVFSPLVLRTLSFPAGALPLAFIALFVPASAVLGSVQATFSAVRDYVARNVAYVAQYLLFFLLCLATLPSWGLVGAGSALLVSCVLVVLGSLVALARRHSFTMTRSPLSGGVLAETWRFARWTTLSATGLVLMSSLDTLMLSSLRGLEAAAVYNIALPVIQIFMVAGVVPIVFTPIAADLWHRGRRDEILDICHVVVRGLVIVGGALMVAVLPSASIIIGILFGGGFERAASPLVVLTLGVPLLVIGQFLLNLLAAMDRPDEVGRVAILAVVANVVLNVCLIRLMGIEGAALATVLAYVILVVLAHRRVASYLQAELVGRRELLAILAAAACCACVAWGDRAAPGIIRSLLLSIMGVLLYLLLVQRLLLSLLKEGWRLLSSPVAEPEQTAGG